jgi:lyso-ornithine lipid O-acyltransferase
MPRGTWRMFWATAMILLVAAALFPFQWLSWRFGWRLQRHLPILFHRAVAWIIDLRVKVEGVPSPHRPMLILSNHVSWLDIVALGTIMPLSFVAKSEVQNWPLFGLLAKLQRSIFIERERRSSTKEQNDLIASRLQEGDPIVLFAESTTSDGNRILPFRSALVGAARAAVTSESQTSDDLTKEVYVQPVSIAYHSADGIPTGRMGRARIGWYGDMDMLPHLKGILRGGALDVTIRFAPALVDDGVVHRKQLTKDAENAVRIMLAEGLTGRKVMPSQPLAVVDSTPLPPETLHAP